MKLLYGASSARAADLGGNCCADLEERIAELEATTVRKGNRKVSLTLSGYVSHHVMFWDDGTQTDTYIADGGNYGSRFRFLGTAKVNPTLTAGFLFEWQSNANAIGSVNQLNGGDDLGPTGAPQANIGGVVYGGCGQVANTLNSSGCISMRQSVVYLRDTKLGMVRIGHGSTATDDLVLIDLGGMTGAATPDVGLCMGGFILRADSGLFAGVSGLNWTAAIRGHESWDTNRRNNVLYETPTLHGFTLQAAVAEDNFWDVALRYAGEFNGIRIAAGIGYHEDTKFNATFQQFDQNGALCSNFCNASVTDLKGSASILHVSSGLFVTFAAGQRELEGTRQPATGGVVGGRYTGPDLTMWWLAGGVSRNFFGPGKTVLFAEYGEHDGGLAQAAFLAPALDAANGHCTVVNGANTAGGTNCDSTVTSWGIGLLQNIDAAAMEIFLVYKNYSLDSNGFVGTSSTLNDNVADMQSVILGTRIQF